MSTFIFTFMLAKMSCRNHRRYIYREVVHIVCSPPHSCLYFIFMFMFAFMFMFVFMFTFTIREWHEDMPA